MSLQRARRILPHAGWLPYLWIALTIALQAHAQYPGRVQDDKAKPITPPRAISVLEWVGEPGKPSASRLVPVTVYDEGAYQDGGLYLAKPEPLAVQSGTEYELQQDGVPKGLFDVFSGQNIQGSWFGYGTWKPLGAPKPVKKLKASKTLPQVVRDADPDRPHFKNDTDAQAGTGAKSGSSSAPGNASGNAPGANQTGSAPTSAPDDDPDKPTLRRRPSPSDAPSSSDTSADAGNGQTTPPADDPDRPHLKSHSSSAPKAGGDTTAPVTSANEPDPDRPRLGRGKPPVTEKQLEATKLTGTPPDLQQMIAISDSTSREERTFAYRWANPDDATKAQAAMEQIAQKAIIDQQTAHDKSSFGEAKSSGGTGSVASTGVKTHHTAAAKTKPAPTLTIPLADEQFKAFELSYGGGPTLVFTAKSGGGNAEKYVTIIARPDFYGVPQVLFTSVTEQMDLDAIPRMRLVDAADTDGDNRAELIFELRGMTDRKFAIYRVSTNRVLQAFATVPLPYGTASHVEQ